MSSAHIKCNSTVTVTVLIFVSLKKKRVISKRGCKIAHTSKSKKKRSRYRDLTKEKIATSKAHPSPA